MIYDICQVCGALIKEPHRGTVFIIENPTMLVACKDCYDKSKREEEKGEA